MSAPPLAPGPTPRVVPGFFGSAAARLLGLHHPARCARPAGAPAGVVLCAPFGPEHLAAHRALRVLAERLSAAGIHALRFDYRGTGDSSGADDDARLSAWRADVHAACDRLRAVTLGAAGGGGGGIGLVGLRLGGLLAGLVAAERRDVARLVLWDAVVDGAEHARGLRARHGAWLAAERLEEDRRPGRDARPDEILGHAFPPALEAELRAAGLLDLARRPAREVLLVHDDACLQGVQLASLLGGLGASVTARPSPEPRVWHKGGNLGGALVPGRLVAQITAWMAKGAQ